MAWVIRAITAKDNQLKLLDSRRREITFETLEEALEKMDFGPYVFEPFFRSYPHRQKIAIKELRIVSNGEPCHLEREELLDEDDLDIDEDGYVMPESPIGTRSSWRDNDW